MPLRLDPGDRRTLLVSGGILLGMVLIALVVLPPRRGAHNAPSSYSSASGGAKAAYLLLAESGRPVARWQRRLADLPLEPDATLILAEPFAAPVKAETDRLREFIAAGGRVIATGPFAGAFLPDAAVLPQPWSIAWRRVAAVSPAAATRAAAEITLVPQAWWHDDLGALPLYSDGEKVLVVKYNHGQGEVYWWASATPLTNAGLREPGNLEFFLACLGPSDRGRVIWNEYIHGHRSDVEPSRIEASVWWPALQIGLIVLAVLATFARRSGPVLVPSGETRLSPLEFVHTLGGLYARARAASVAVEVCHQRFRYWATRRLGLPGDAPIDQVERALAERWRFSDDRFAPTLRACEAARDRHDLRGAEALRLVRALYGYAATLGLFGARPRPAAGGDAGRRVGHAVDGVR